MKDRISRRNWLRQTGMASLVLGTAPRLFSAQTKRRHLTNIVLIFTDDQGYGDAGCYGAKGYATPNLDRMAAEGVRFTDFYAPYASCSPSRAGLLTGCYPPRVGINYVLGPGSRIGLNPAETTIADMLKPLGYATACIGKWHLGHLPQFLPLEQGFDEYFGLPYSNDMWPVGYDGKPRKNSHYPPLPLIEGNKPIEIIDTLEKQATLTTRYTERAISFIRRNRRRPFFLYLAHSMVHVPIAVSERFRGRSRQGLFGDVVMELDWSVGRILAALSELGIDENTLVVFTSDNGPWLNFGNHAGSAGPLRSGKGTTWDGGQREIGLMRWPGTIPAGVVCGEMVSAIDLLPTFAAITGAPLPKRKIDGKSILPLMKGVPGAKTPHEALFFHYGGKGKLEAVRSGRWKLHFPHSYRRYEGFEPGRDGYPGKVGRGSIGWALYDLRTDIGERRNVAGQHPHVVARLRALGEAHEKEILANARRPGGAPGPLRIVPTQPKVLKPGPDGNIDLPALNCRIHNPGPARYVANRDRRNVGCWHSLDTYVSWDVEFPAAGNYEVRVTQSLAAPLEGSEFTVRVGRSGVRGKVRTTGGWTQFTTVTPGVIHVEGPGRATVEMHPEKLAGGRCLMNLRGIRLVPVK